MNRRGFFASVLALVAGGRATSGFRPLSPVPAPVNRFDYGAPSVFSGDWTIYGARYHCTTYAVRMPVSALAFARGWELKA